MDLDIQFGDLEESQPDSRLRPDQDMHFAVVECGTADQCEFPIYVYADVVVDIENHALSDTTVELGGVLLGGQYEDEDGEPFIVIRDWLRAEHYEATKGSFKFTHETWEQITRQREEFSDDFEMVGWYHTHPDWGVFLSSMDMFICDNFFNRPLDVALVVDPCREDRGWFQWTGQPMERIRRSGGFYLVGSRFRQPELEQLCSVLSGDDAMSFDSRMRAVAGQVGPSSPVVNVNERDSSHLNYAVLGMLAIQFVFVAIVAWRLLGGDPDPATDDRELSDAQIQLTEKLDESMRQNDAAIRADAQQEVFSLIATHLGGAPLDFAAEIEAREMEIREHEASLFAQTEINRQLNSENVNLRDANGSLAKRNGNLSDRVQQRNDRIRLLEEKVEELEDDEAGTGTVAFYRDWRAILTAFILVGIAAGCGFALGNNFRKVSQELDDRTPDFKMKDFDRLRDAAESMATQDPPPESSEPVEIDDESEEK